MQKMEINLLKKILLCCLILASVFSVATSIADDNVSFGVGAGALYNGLGANVSFVKKSDLKYVSLGCIAIGYSSNNGTSSNCGIGAGWMRSDILSENNKHGLGIHIGVTYNTSNDRNDTETFIGVPYVYFFKGMTSGGWNIGLTPIIGKHNGSIKGGLLLNLGYQF